jgi:7-cyano-7-deazaguanine synthase in queuosine biosynthesis
VKVALAAFPTLGHQYSLTDGDNFQTESRGKISRHRADRHFNNQVFSAFSVVKLIFTVITVISRNLFLKMKLIESVDIRNAFQINTAAFTAVGSGRTQVHFGFIKTDGSSAAFSSNEFNFNVVN